MKKFIHRASHASVTSYEFIRDIRSIPGLYVEAYGYLAVGTRMPFEVHFTADTQAELYLRVKFEEGMFEEKL